MQTKSGLTVPCFLNDWGVMQKMLHRTVPPGGLSIKEVYAAVPGVRLHGRADETVEHVDRDKSLHVRGKIREAGVAFTCLLNAPIRHIELQVLMPYLEWILRDLRPDALTISSFELMELVRQMDRDVPIHISTIAAVRCSHDLERFLPFRPNRVIPHHDLGKSWKELDALAVFCKKEGMEPPEILITESCIPDCAVRTMHYASLVEHTADMKFHNSCWGAKFTDPGLILMAGAAICPEDLRLLEDRGVCRFKISGRDRPAETMLGVVEAYQYRRYFGNLIHLLDVTPGLSTDDIFVSNAALAGFLENYPQTDLPARKAYSDSWMIQLYQNGDFYIRGASYVEKNGRLVLKPELSVSNIFAANRR